MSAPSNTNVHEALPALATPAGIGVSFRVANRRRRILVNVLRVLIVVVIIGGWELFARTKVIDSFFWGQPSGIWKQIVIWVKDGTAQGPLWDQIYATLQEAVIGFVIGVALG